MSLDHQVLNELMPLFQAEAQDYLQALNRLLLDLEKQPDAAETRRLLNEIFRAAHTLKGSARVVRLDNVSALAHALETLFGRMQRGLVALAPETFDQVYPVLDLIASLVAKAATGDAPTVDLAAQVARLESIGTEIPTIQIAPPLPAPMSPAAPADTTQESPAVQVETWHQAPAPRAPNPIISAHPETPVNETIRLAVAKLDALFADVGELQVTRIEGDQRLIEMHALLALLETWQAQWRHIRPAYRKLLPRLEAGAEPTRADNAELQALFEFLAANEDQLRDARLAVDALERRLKADSRRIAQVATDLQEDVRRMRMMPASTVFEPFPRMARDLARDLGKEIHLAIEGGETELDRATLEQIKAPLLHLIRNAIDHGVEPPTQREAMGKPRAGTITLSASQRGGRIIIEIADDGAGIDSNQVKISAVKKGMLTEQAAQAMSAREALWLILRSGVSTRARVSDVSGRGVGMDVVREVVEQLQGVIDLQSAVDKGTTISLSLPLTVAATLCLLARVGAETFAIPLLNVDRIMRVGTDEIARAQGYAVVQDAGRPIALVALADVLQTPPAAGETRTNGKKPAIILGAADQRAAFLVDHLIGAQEIVIKNLPRPFVRVRYAAGAAILGTGQVVLALNVADLLKAPSHGAAPAQASAAARTVNAPTTQTILLADDSITTRALEKNILQAAGYQVRVAVDGAEALTRLQSEGIAPDGMFNLLVSDVTMPRMDGFDLTAKIRADERLKHLPVILVTSLASREDRARGIQVGADAYLVKSSFDQNDLLATIRQLI